MERVETKTRPNVDLLTETLREMSSMGDPREVMATFGRSFRRIRPFNLIASVSQRGLQDGQYKVTRVFSPEDLPGPDASREELDDLPDPWRTWQSLTTHTGAFFGSVMSEPVPQLWRNLDLRDDPVIGDKVREIGGVGSCQAIPAYDGGEAINWLFRFRPDPDGFTMDEFEQDILTTNLFGGATKNLVTAKQLEAANLRLRDEFQQIAQIQMALLPSKSPKIHGLQLATSYLTSDQAGGDYFDFFPFADGSWGILIADVSGHGAAAATVMAMLRAILHCYEDPEPTPDKILNFANDRLVRSNLEGSFVTAFFAIYDPKNGTLHYARCGHNPPRLRHADGSITNLDHDGTVPLGLFSPIEARSAAIKLQEGDVVVLYTDGITEAMDDDREMFGVERLDAAIHAAPPCPDRLVEMIHSELFGFTGSRDRDDDQTIVAFRYSGDEVCAQAGS